MSYHLWKDLNFQLGKPEKRLVKSQEWITNGGISGREERLASYGISFLNRVKIIKHAHLFKMLVQSCYICIKYFKLFLISIWNIYNFSLKWG